MLITCFAKMNEHQNHRMFSNFVFMLQTQCVQTHIESEENREARKMARVLNKNVNASFSVY